MFISTLYYGLVWNEEKMVKLKMNLKVKYKVISVMFTFFLEDQRVVLSVPRSDKTNDGRCAVLIQEGHQYKWMSVNCSDRYTTMCLLSPGQYPH